MAYTLQGQKCGAVRFIASTNGVVNNESVSRSSKVTQNPIESGSDINDHVVKDPEKLTITGIVVGGSGEAAKLKAMWDKRDLLTYTGRVRYSNMEITNYKEDISAKNSKGFSFTITMQKVTITSAAYVPMGETPLMSQQDADKPTSQTGSRGTQQAGLSTTVSTNISSGAYANYVNTYNNKPASSSGPSTRSSPSYNGVAA